MAEELAKLQSLMRELTPAPPFTPPAPSRQPFMRVPKDVILRIVKHLQDPINQVSLALTSKTVWNCTKETVQGEFGVFELPSILPPRARQEVGVIQPWPYFSSPRWRLLERLEDYDWKCCAGCLRLQPKSEFFFKELRNEATDRSCRAPGLIQVYPGMFLTYKKCIQLRQALTQQRYAKGASEHEKKADVNAELVLEHHELKARNLSTKVRFFMQPLICSDSGHLLIQQKHILELKSRDLKRTFAWIDNNFRFPDLCPHRSLVSHCLDMIDETTPWNPDFILSKAKAIEGNRSSIIRCKFCRMQFSDFEKSVISETPLTYQSKFSTLRRILHRGELKEGETGHSCPGDLQLWLDMVDLSHVIVVRYFDRPNCLCRPDCQRLAFQRFESHPRGMPFPQTLWKGEMNVRW